MRQQTRAASAAIAVIALLVFARDGKGQLRTRDSATVTPNAQYQAGPMARAILGSGWRNVWVEPVRVPVLSLGDYAGGLDVIKRGGGFQTITLHLKEDDGWKEYRFRSVDKFPLTQLPRSLKGTTVGAIVQDQVSTLFPGAPVLVPPFVHAVGLLHVEPDLYVMGDDPRLGVHRDTFAGMLGTMELKGEEAPDDKPGFAGAREIKDTEDFFEDLEESRAHRLDEAEFLAARLVDFLINDTDRTRDNFDWARFGDEGAYRWRPIPRDRDNAFMDARGLLTTFVSRRFQPRLTAFSPRYALTGLIHNSSPLDRRLLQRLTREDFERVAVRVRDAVTDDVIERAIAQLPASWRSETTAPDRLRATLRARRDALPAVAMRFYRRLATEVDIHGTKEAELADVVRHADGSVTVTITDLQIPPLVASLARGRRFARDDAGVRRADGRVETTSGGEVTSANDAGGGPFFMRTFSPAETREIRVYLAGGDDRVVMRGTSSKAIVVRVVGGAGNDVYVDPVGGVTHFYDEEGSNRLETATDGRIDAKPWAPPKIRSGVRFGQAWRPDWGGSSGSTAVVDYGTSAGVILGAGYEFRRYGFRRLPHRWEAGVTLLYGTGNGRFGMEGDAEYWMENSPMGFALGARATQLDALRFYGYGNNTPSVSSDVSIVEQTVLSLQPGVVWRVGWRAREHLAGPLHEDSVAHVGARPLVGRIKAGPVVQWFDPEPSAVSMLTLSSATGRAAFGYLGARLGVELDRTDRDAIPTQGWRLEAGLDAAPPMLGLSDAFTSSRAMGAVYVPISAAGASLAFRGGGALASGDVPVQFAPTVGGWSSLRGYPWRRYTGDAAVDGAAELRVPVGTLNLLVRWDVGVFGLADAGRVWFDGQSDGGWHTGVGGGLWLSAMGRSVSIAYARGQGEGNRFYLKTGLF